ncbi:hypothetical protein FBQ82_03185 [Anaerolineae bacterium CFX7]|nr:hypothetical protein [Anaerolineae bacterium CFX7]
MRRTHTFVLQVLLERAPDAGQAAHPTSLRGQISEPSSADEWRARFADVDELLQELLKRVAVEAGEMELELARQRVEPNAGKE